MPNMSHCRFQNTKADLVDCQEVIEALANNEDSPALSHEETLAAVNLVETCIDIVTLISEELGVDTLDDLCYRFNRHGELRAIFDKWNKAAGAL